MRVLEKRKTPDDVKIQLEDWEGEYHIGAYPIAQNYGKWLINKGETFRLTLYPRKGEDMVEIFEELEKGDVSLEELAELYWNGEKDMYYMGLI